MTDATLNLSVEDCAAGLDQLLQDRADPKGRISLNPETVEQDLARLVLGLMEFLRRLMELQAIRRMERGTLTEEEEERLGLTLMRASTALRDVAGKFGLTEDDLSLDFGPLGKLS
ncbi:MAG: gas vesicle protein K [Pseudomonadota bacterium]